MEENKDKQKETKDVKLDFIVVNIGGSGSENMIRNGHLDDGKSEVFEGDDARWSAQPLPMWLGTQVYASSEARLLFTGKKKLVESLHIIPSHEFESFPSSSEYDFINLQIKLFTMTMSSYLKVSGKWSMRLWTL